MFKAIKKTRIHEEVVLQIHELIRAGRFRAGDQLPSERELAETFQVSRTSVREALRALETQGLIVSKTGMGTFVADLPIESLVAPLARMLIEEKNALAEVFELRKLIEPQIAALAADRASARDIERMKNLLRKQKTQVEGGATGVEADTELHFAIGQATQNRAVTKLVSGLLDVLSRSREESLQTEARRQASITAHRSVVAAIERHDPVEANKAMRRHIEQVERNVLVGTGKRPKDRRAKKIAAFPEASENDSHA